MFERFTDEARRVVALAQEEARLLSHTSIGTEHLFLAVVHDRECVAARALSALGISLEAVRAEVEKEVGHGSSMPSGDIPFTAGAEKAFELALRETLSTGADHIGTEQVLLGAHRGRADRRGLQYARRLLRRSRRAFSARP